MDTGNLYYSRTNAGRSYKEGRARFIRYNFSDYPKDDVINMLKRTDLDLSIFMSMVCPNVNIFPVVPLLIGGMLM